MERRGGCRDDCSIDKYLGGSPLSIQIDLGNAIAIRLDGLDFVIERLPYQSVAVFVEKGCACRLSDRCAKGGAKGNLATERGATFAMDGCVSGLW